MTPLVLKCLKPLNQLVAFGCDLEVVVARVHCAADEVVVLDDQLLVSLCLLFISDHIRRCAPKQMIAEKHSN
jgi:hypothetical protein